VALVDVDVARSHGDEAHGVEVLAECATVSGAKLDIAAARRSASRRLIALACDAPAMAPNIVRMLPAPCHWSATEQLRAGHPRRRRHDRAGRVASGLGDLEHLVDPASRRLPALWRTARRTPARR